jgi:hypothetical protein
MGVFSGFHAHFFPQLKHWATRTHEVWDRLYLQVLLEGNFEDYDFLVASADKSSPAGMAVEAVLKGIEVPLPEGSLFKTPVGSTKRHIRARWWDTPVVGIRCDELVFPANCDIPAIPVAPEALKMLVPYPLDERPLFFGHYFKPADSPLAPERHNVACLDHSAAKEGPLVAYRWKGCVSINPEHYISHS